MHVGRADRVPRAVTGVSRSRGPSRGDRAHIDRSSDRTDLQLQRRIQAGDEEAFDALYLRHARSLWGLAYSLVRSEADAEEIVHDVFLAIWNHRETWVISTGVLPYLFRATRNRAVNHLRHQRVVTQVETDASWHDNPPGMSDVPAPLDDVVVADDIEAVVRRTIDALPERRRLVLVLRIEHHLSFSQIGEVMQISEKAAQVLFARARESLTPLLALFDHGG